MKMSSDICNLTSSIINYTYDLTGKLIRKETADNTTELFYDKDSLLTEISDNDSQVKYFYDGKGHLQWVDNKIFYGYDNAGRRIRMRYFDNGNEVIDVNYTYNARGLVVGIDAEIFNKEVSWSREYDELGRPIHETLPNGINTSYDYDFAGRLTSLHNKLSNNNLISGFDYTYSPSNNIVQIIKKESGINTTEGVETIGYNYDNLDRLTNASSDGFYTYDELGNQIQTGQTYNKLNQLLEDSLFTYTYTINGNLDLKTNKRTNKVFDYDWDNENKLIQIEIKTQSISEKTITFKYDGLGRRIETKIVDHLKANLSSTRKYTYDAEDVLFERDQTGRIVAVYLHGPGIDNPLFKF